VFGGAGNTDATAGEPLYPAYSHEEKNMWFLETPVSPMIFVASVRRCQFE